MRRSTSIVTVVLVSILFGPKGASAEPMVIGPANIKLKRVFGADLDIPVIFEFATSTRRERLDSELKIKLGLDDIVGKLVPIINANLRSAGNCAMLRRANVALKPGGNQILVSLEGSKLKSKCPEPFSFLNNLLDGSFTASASAEVLFFNKQQEIGYAVTNLDIRSNESGIGSGAFNIIFKGATTLANVASRIFGKREGYKFVNGRVKLPVPASLAPFNLKMESFKLSPPGEPIYLTINATSTIYADYITKQIEEEGGRLIQRQVDQLGAPPPKPGV